MLRVSPTTQMICATVMILDTSSFQKGVDDPIQRGSGNFRYVAINDLLWTEL